MVVHLAKDLKFPPVPNGIDYLVSVVEHLAREGHVNPSPRDLKYAVLHLQAAAEVLLKARLIQEHWTLAVKDAGKTNKGKYEIGQFESVTPAETVRRLAQVLGIEISKTDEELLSRLVSTRNALQHWGLTESVAAIESRAANVLDFLIRFLDKELLPGLPAPEFAVIERDLNDVRDGLRNIRGFVSARMDRIRAEFLSQESAIVLCPDCAQAAVVVESGALRCEFCGKNWDELSDLMDNYVTDVIGFSWHDRAEGIPEPTGRCPECGDETLVFGALTARFPDGTSFCFACTESFDNLQECVRCAEMFVPQEEELICTDCFSAVVAE